MKFLTVIPGVLLVLSLFKFCQGDPVVKIVNGTDVKEGEAPFAVSVRYFNMHECGGSIIAPKWVLTAAHCVYPDFINVSTILYGTIYLQNGEEPTGHIIPVIDGLQHENYVPSGGYENDIGLLELETYLRFSGYVQPTILPQSFEATPEGSVALLVGWGYATTDGDVMNVLQRVDIVIFSEESCQQAHDGLTNPLLHICAGVPEGGRGQCSGDSGGPLIVNGSQVGIVSWSVKPCTIAGYPGVFSRVSAHRNWIYQHTGI